MDESLAWERVSLPDRRAALEAFDALCRHLRVRMQRFLVVKYQADAQDAEDAVQTAFIKLSKAAPTSVWPNEQAGRSWLFQTVKTCFFDVIRGRGIDPPPPSSPDDKRDFVKQLHAAILLGEIFHFADAFWLGLDPSLSPAAYKRFLLAAQMYYLEGCSNTEIPRLLGCPPADEPEVTAALVLKWVHDPGVIRLLAYHTLRLEHGPLIAALLGVAEARVSPNLLQDLWVRALALPPEEPALGELTWALVALILLRYRDNYPVSAVAAQTPCREWGYTAEQIQERIATITARLPFAGLMLDLLESLEEDTVEPRPVLVDPGLWKRLAFQYWYREQIPLHDVYERIRLASDQVDYKLNSDMLNTWLSGRQLSKRLVKYWWDRAGGGWDE